MSRNLDELVTSTEHARPVHPFRELFSHHFYLDSVVDTDGGLWIALINALLVIPLVMAAFFYPVEALIIALATAAVALVGWVIWKRRRVPV